jgi:hypothetical protein
VDWIEGSARDEAHRKRSPTMVTLERRGTNGGSMDQWSRGRRSGRRDARDRRGARGGQGRGGHSSTRRHSGTLRDSTVTRWVVRGKQLQGLDARAQRGLVQHKDGKYGDGSGP